jgi:DNA-directed RNA polymerase specialized sigma24 family protein
MQGESKKLAAELSRAERLVVMLRWGERLSYAEIAVVVELSEDEVQGIAQSLVRRVRGALHRPRSPR